MDRAKQARRAISGKFADATIDEEVIVCLRAPLEAFSGSQSYRCKGHLALFALGRLLSRPLRRRKLAKQLRWSEPGGVVIVGLFGLFELTCGGCTSRFKARARPKLLDPDLDRRVSGIS